MAHLPRSDGRVHGVVVGLQHPDDLDAGSPTPRWLIIRRSQHVIAPLTLAFPGGGIEPTETEEAAARRETLEEVGVHATPLRRVWHWDAPDRPLKLFGWLAQWNGDTASLRADPREVCELHWMTAAQIATHADALPGSELFAATLDQYIRS